MNRLIEITLYHKNKVSKGNTFYDWDSTQGDILSARVDWKMFAQLALDGKIDEDAYIGALYVYFDVVYNETYKAWRRARDNYRIEYELANPKYPHLPVDCVVIKSKELEFINERWRCWTYRDGENQVDDEIDNRIGEIDYSYIELPDPTIREKSYIVAFGKYGRLGELGRCRTYTVGELLREDPQYLLWAAKNTEKLPLSEELYQEACEWAQHFEERREARKQN